MNVGATDMQSLRAFALYLHQMYREPIALVVGIWFWFSAHVLQRRGDKIRHK
jgi:hypothetical protein